MSSKKPEAKSRLPFFSDLSKLPDHVRYDNGKVRDGDLLDFVVRYSNVDVGTILSALAGDAPMPIDALLAGAPFSNNDIHHDLREWHGLMAAEGTGYDAASRAIRDAAQHPSPATLDPIRAVLPEHEDKDRRRLDFLLALYGDTDAADRLRKIHAGQPDVQAAFVEGLYVHARKVKNSSKAFEWTSGAQLRILFSGIEILKNRHDTIARLLGTMDAWRVATEEIVSAKVQAGVASAYGAPADAALDAANILIAHDAKVRKEHEEADQKWLEVEGRLPKKPEVPADVLAALDLLEREADTQINVDLSDPSNFVWILEEAAKLEARWSANAAVNDAVAAISLVKASMKIETPEIPSSVQVLAKIDLGGLKAVVNSSSNENELLRLYAPMSGTALPLCLGSPNVGMLREDLVAAYPHAVGVVDVLLQNMQSGRPVRMRPILLVGAPGSGKTTLLKLLCSALWLPHVVYPCASVSDNSFGGTAAQWATRRASIPLDAIRQNGCANPAVILDELEKAGGSERNGSLTNALLPFLEMHSSSAYFEPGLERPADLSWVSFLATANDVDSIPAPLRDRFRVVRVPDPGPQHIGDLARRIVRDIMRERQIDPMWSPPLAPDEEDVIRKAWGGGSLRRLRRAVEATLDARDAALRSRAM